MMGKLASRGMIAAISAAFASCSVLDPNQVGSGQYLQLFDSAGLLVEADTSNAGLQQCPTSAYELVRTNPGLTGRVRCSHTPGGGDLKFWFKAWNQSSPHADEKQHSSAYMVKARTSALCNEMLDVHRRRPKLVVLEDNCGGLNASSAPSAPQDTPATGRLLAIVRTGATVAQIETSNAKECEQLTVENSALLRRVVRGEGYRYLCTSADASSTLNYHAVVRDQLAGQVLKVLAITDLMCQSVVAEIGKVRVVSVDRPRYGVVAACDRTR